MDYRFWTALVVGLTTNMAIIHAILGQMSMAVLMAALGGLNLYVYGMVKAKEEEDASQNRD